MEICVCIFIIAASIIFFGLGAVGVYCVFVIAKIDLTVKAEREYAKIALRKQLLKMRMQLKLTRCEYETYSKEIENEI